MNEHINNRMVKRREPKTCGPVTTRELLGREFRKARHAELEPETVRQATIATALAEEAMHHPSES